MLLQPQSVVASLCCVAGPLPRQPKVASILLQQELVHAFFCRWLPPSIWVPQYRNGQGQSGQQIQMRLQGWQSRWQFRW